MIFTIGLMSVYAESSRLNKGVEEYNPVCGSFSSDPAFLLCGIANADVHQTS